MTNLKKQCRKSVATVRPILIQEASTDPNVLSESGESGPDCLTLIQRTLKRVDDILAELVSFYNEQRSQTHVATCMHQIIRAL